MKLRHSPISIPTAQVWLEALLCHAPDVHAVALILQSTATPDGVEREDEVSRTLQGAGFATLHLDLLTHHEAARDPDMRFNVAQLALRIEGVREWIAHQPPLRGLAVGLVASDTACAAAVRSASRNPALYSALACRGGRPDLAGAAPLRKLRTPVRIVAPAADAGVAMLRQAYELIGSEKDWHSVTDADEHFAAPGTLARFAVLATEWLQAHPTVAEGLGTEEAAPQTY
jgi:putative phosphoribosyl transferase